MEDLLGLKGHGLVLRLVAGEKGLKRRIKKYRIQKSGLTMTGLFENVHEERIQIVGQNEISYLKTLPHERQKEVLLGIAKKGAPCLIVTRGLEPTPAFLEVAEEIDLPVLSTDQISSTFITTLNRHLESNLAASTTIHGVLVDVIGIGVLVIGKSGIGKSECALELLLKGHILVADDVVEVKKIDRDSVWGNCSPIAKHHMEIRGLGILNIAQLFGVTAVRDRKEIHLVLELVHWDGNTEYDRLGLEHKTFDILDVSLPLITVPVSQGRNMSTIIEVAARNYLLQQRGIHSALSFQQKLDTRMIRERLGSLVPQKPPAPNRKPGGSDE